MPKVSLSVATAGHTVKQPTKTKTITGVIGSARNDTWAGRIVERLVKWEEDKIEIREGE